jgi:hypothetical protein
VPFQSSPPPAATTALIAAAGVVVGALVTALAAAYAAKQKTREVELTYRQKLQDNYLANARQFIEEVYVPISIALGTLSDAFQFAKQFIDDKAGTIDPAAQNFFGTSRDAYMLTIDDLFARGADAYLTSAVEIRLRSFNSFLRASATAVKPVVRLSFQVSGWAFPLSSLSSTAVTTEIGGKLASGLYGNRASFNFFGFGFSYDAKELIGGWATDRPIRRFWVPHPFGVWFCKGCGF